MKGLIKRRFRHGKKAGGDLPSAVEIPANLRQAENLVLHQAVAASSCRQDQRAAAHLPSPAKRLAQSVFGQRRQARVAPQVVSERDGHSRQTLQCSTDLVGNVVPDVSPRRELHRHHDHSRCSTASEVFKPVVDCRLGDFEKAGFHRDAAGPGRHFTAEVKKGLIAPRLTRAVPYQKDAGLSVRSD